MIREHGGCVRVEIAHKMSIQSEIGSALCSQPKTQHEFPSANATTYKHIKIMWFYVENVTVFVGGFFPSSFLWHCSNQLSSIFVRRERSERASEKRTRPPINCSDNEYNVDRRSFSWIFIHRVVFLLLISKFQSECRTPSVPSKCFLRLRSQNYSIFFVCVLMLCNGIENRCQAHNFRLETRMNLCREIICEPHSNIQVLSVFSHFNCICIALHCICAHRFCCMIFVSRFFRI